MQVTYATNTEEDTEAEVSDDTSETGPDPLPPPPPQQALFHTPPSAPPASLAPPIVGDSTSAFLAGSANPF